MMQSIGFTAQLDGSLPFFTPNHKTSDNVLDMAEPAGQCKPYILVQKNTHSVVRSCEIWVGAFLFIYEMSFIFIALSQIYTRVYGAPTHNNVSSASYNN